MIIQPKIKNIYSVLLKLAIIFISYGFIIRQVLFKENIREIYLYFKLFSFTVSFVFILLFVFLLMFVNWGIEAIKWKYLIGKIEKVSFFRSCKAILCSATFNTFAPNRTGDYLGRIFLLKKAGYWEGIFVTVIGSFSQLIVIVSVGLLGGGYFISHYTFMNIYFNGNIFLLLFLVIIIFIVLLIVLYLNISILTMLIRRIRFFKTKTFRFYTRIFSIYSTKELVRILLLSLFRYIVFSLQLYLLFILFNVRIPFVDAMSIISFHFFIITVIPSFALTELGVRGSVAILLMNIYYSTQIYQEPSYIAIISATSVLWLINLILPALIGSFFVFNLNFFRKKES